MKRDKLKKKEEKQIENNKSRKSYKNLSIQPVCTVIISSTNWWQTLNVSAPTVFTAAPSAKSPTVGRVTTLPALRDAVIPKK